MLCFFSYKLIVEVVVLEGDISCVRLDNDKCLLYFDDLGLEIC